MVASQQPTMPKAKGKRAKKGKQDQKAGNPDNLSVSSDPNRTPQLDDSSPTNNAFEQAAAPRSTACMFMSLPGEVRNMIYNSLFAHSTLS